MSGKYCAVFLIFAAFARFGNPIDEEWVLHGSKETNEGNLKIRLVRATATKLYVEAMCDPSCSGIQWETLTFRYGFSSSTKSKVEDLGDGHYVLEGLYPYFDYIVQARLGGSFDRIRARTCADYLGRLKDLRSYHNGPGWLDISWTPYSFYECKQDIMYTVRYKVEGGNFSEPRTYGYYPVDDKGTLHIGPSHPCDDWPTRFCLLITEGVEAGKNHTVEIVPQRIGGGRSDRGTTTVIVAYADPHNIQGSPDGGVHPDCQMWAWLAVGASLFCIAIIIGILISSLITTYEKNERLREEALNAENENSGENEENGDAEGNEETEETALTAGTPDLRKSREVSENNENKEKPKQH